jgi:hypothetical protein
MQEGSQFTLFMQKISGKDVKKGKQKRHIKRALTKVGLVFSLGDKEFHRRHSQKRSEKTSGRGQAAIAAAVVASTTIHERSPF